MFPCYIVNNISTNNKSTNNISTNHISTNNISTRQHIYEQHIYEQHIYETTYLRTTYLRTTYLRTTYLRDNISTRQHSYTHGMNQKTDFHKKRKKTCLIDGHVREFQTSYTCFFHVTQLVYGEGGVMWTFSTISMHSFPSVLLLLSFTLYV